MLSSVPKNRPFSSLAAFNAAQNQPQGGLDLKCPGLATALDIGPSGTVLYQYFEGDRKCSYTLFGTRFSVDEF